MGVFTVKNTKAILLLLLKTERNSSTVTLWMLKRSSHSSALRQLSSVFADMEAIEMCVFTNRSKYGRGRNYFPVKKSDFNTVREQRRLCKQLLCGYLIRLGFIYSKLQTQLKPICLPPRSRSLFYEEWVQLQWICEAGCCFVKIKTKTTTKNWTCCFNVKSVSRMFCTNTIYKQLSMFCLIFFMSVI